MFVVKELIQECGACPSSWSGKLEDGRSIFIRYRYGTLRVTEDRRNVTLFEIDHGDELDGLMNFKELKDVLGERFVFDCEEMPPSDDFDYDWEGGQSSWANDRNDM